VKQRANQLLQAEVERLTAQLAGAAFYLLY
jgi:uncharacterized small protein (DUF1192 family)